MTDLIPFDALDGTDEHNRASPETRPKKRLESDITTIIRKWAYTAKSSRKSLLDIELSKYDDVNISYTYLEAQLGIVSSVLDSRSEIINSVIKKMIDEKIVIPEYDSLGNEWRRKLLRWYENLSDEEKLNIPIVANKISAKRCLEKVEGMGNLKWALREVPLAKLTYDEITEDLKRIGVIKSDYKTVEVRNSETASKRQAKGKPETWEETLTSLRAIPLSNIDDLVAHDPNRPFKKLLHMYAAASMKVGSVSGQKNYIEGFRFAVQCLVALGFKGDEEPTEFVTPSYLTQIKRFVIEKADAGDMSTSVAQGVIASARQMLKRALKIKGIGFTTYIDVEGIKPTRQTDEYRPYSSTERTRIKDVCLKEMQATNLLAVDYVRFNGGCDPVDSNGHIKTGLGTLDNARWIFENKLICQRLSKSTADMSNVYERAISKIFDYSNTAIADIYKSWGIIYEITSGVLSPYIIRLAQVTGLNADSIKALNVHDFVKSHEVTKRPYLRYWKERSGGEKYYPLDLMDSDYTWLTLAQSREVEKIFNDVVFLTRSIRDRAVGSDKERLFLFESQKMNEFRVVRSIDDSNIINFIMTRFSKDQDLKNDADDPLSLSASRLRPSFVADMVDAGVSIREIQVILGHKYVSTTIKYLDGLEFSKTSQKVVDEALRKIHKEAVVEAASQKKSAADTQDSNGSATDQSDSLAVPIKTGLVECRNVYDPPEEIKKLAGYKQGSPCSLLNKCISCRNSIITVSNLPGLFAMRRDYRSMMETSAVSQTPYGRVIRENLEVLDSILTPSVQGFDAEQLEQGERLSRYIITSTLVEGMTL